MALPLRRALCFALAGIGLLISGVLLARTFALLQGQSSRSLNICSAVFGSNCDETLVSASSWQFGIPLAGWGVVYYALLLALFVLGIAFGDAFRRESAAAAFVVSLGGLAVSVFLVWTMFSGSAEYCPLCAATHAVNLTLVGAIVWADGRHPRAMIGDALSGLRYLLGGETKRPDLAPWKLTSFIAVALVGVVLYQWVFIRTRLIAPPVHADHVHEDVFAEYQRGALHDIPVRPDDPRKGSPSAPVQFVVFSDFQCPACAGFARHLDSVFERNSDRISVVFKHFPLGLECNPSMNTDFHPRACEAAYAAEAAREQGLFWPFHDVALNADLAGKPIRDVAAQAGLDLIRFDNSMNQLVGRNRIREDVEIGNRLGIEGTPTVFVNGRELLPFDATSMQTVIDKLLTD